MYLSFEVVISIHRGDFIPFEVAEHSSVDTSVVTLGVEARVFIADITTIVGVTNSSTTVEVTSSPSVASKSQASCLCSSRAALVEPSIVLPFLKLQASSVFLPDVC